jgi:hypothetical protein
MELPSAIRETISAVASTWPCGDEHGLSIDLVKRRGSKRESEVVGTKPMQAVDRRRPDNGSGDAYLDHMSPEPGMRCHGPFDVDLVSDFQLACKIDFHAHQYLLPLK